MVQVRRATQRDAEAIAKLAAQAAAEEGLASGLDQDRVRAYGFGGAALFEIWVGECKKAKAPVAHAIITKSYDVRRGAPTVVLCELYVAPEYRRTGLARRLMSAVAQRAVALGARELAITTGIGNDAAQRFFAAVGANPHKAAVFLMSADGIQWLATEGQ